MVRSRSSLPPGSRHHKRVIPVLSEAKSIPFTVWIDIENPPQVQYLLPFRAAFEAAGFETVITARDYGATLEMLEDAGVRAHVFGTSVGRGKLRKVVSAAERAREMRRFFGSTRPPDALLCASRAGAWVAWRLGIPSFLISDYEYAFLRVYRLTRSTIVFPEVIESDHFYRQGLRREQLMPVKGIKEDLTFSGVDIDATQPADIGPMPNGAVRVLFRPPSETSHYYRKASSTMARATLQRLAELDVLVVFSPRAPGQVVLLEGLDWKHQPIVLTQPVPFISLLKSVDAVVCSGGTMLREAAYLGIPAYSIFQSEIGAVDRWLESIGRATLIHGPADLDKLEVKSRGPLSRLDSNPDLLQEIATIVTGGAPKAPRLVPLAA